ncbi:MAG: hypothetical protein ACO1QB_09020 [Verrucomicrobiales bacterium]
MRRAPIAWQPFTFGGVSAFAHANASRVIGFAFGSSLLLGAVMGWIFFVLYVPRLDEAFSKLPDQGASILRGRLVWPGTEASLLSEGPFLGMAVDPLSGREPIQTADLSLILAPRELVISSMFGYTPIPYPRELSVILNRPLVEPWWGAWRVFIAFGAAAGIFLGLLVAWFSLALLYAGPVRFLGFYLDRAFTISGGFKLSLAALLLPGLFMGTAILLYSNHELTLMGLAISFGLHFVFQWLYLIGGVLKAPSMRQGGKNPFQNSDSDLGENGEKEG